MADTGLIETRVTVAAVVGPVERARLDAAGAGCISIIHRPSVPAAARTVRERAVDAIVLSVHQCAHEPSDAIDHLVRSFPEIPTVALVSRPDPQTPATLLRLGANGVRHVVDVSDPSGWTRLRHLLLEPVSRPAARILARLGDHLERIPPEARMFTEFMVRVAPSTPNVRLLAEQARVAPSTLVSRFLRAGLPSPKSYLAGIRLLYAAQFFEQEGLTVADVAYRLECSSPQSFGRHLRAMLGVTAAEFRRRYSFDQAVERFIAVLVRPYRDRWSIFCPLVAEPHRRPRRSRKRPLSQELADRDQ